MLAKKRKAGKLLPAGHENPMTGTPSEDTKTLQANILRLRRDDPGMPWREMRELLGYPEQYLKKLHKEALLAIIREPVEEVVTMELERLDMLQTEVIKVLRSFHPVVNQGRIIRDMVTDELGDPVLKEGRPVFVKISDAGPKLAAIDRALKIMERRTKYLGLDKQQGDPNKAGLTAEEFAAQVLGITKAFDEVSGGAAGA
jgi:hypothetical protein